MNLEEIKRIAQVSVHEKDFVDNEESLVYEGMHKVAEACLPIIEELEARNKKLEKQIKKSFKIFKDYYVDPSRLKRIARLFTNRDREVYD